MDKFLEKYNLPKLSQEESENLNGQITSGIKAVIKKKKSKTQKSWNNGFTGGFYQTCKEGQTPIHLKLFQKFKRREDSQAHLMSPALSYFQNQIKTLQRKKIIGQYL